MPVSFHRAGAALLLCALGLTACSPTFNWRETRVEGTPLQALMPCKPDAAQRSVPLLGTPTELHLLSCEAGGLRFALAWAEVPDADQLRPATLAWRSASLMAIRVSSPPDDEASTAWPVKVAGAAQVLGVSAQGQDPSGAAVQIRAAYFAQGQQVFQAAVYGERLPAEALDTFFGGLRLPTP
ncbi:hypothetical protein [Hydrogenophaga sp.]|uniref:hypothetical protein n=1 Tax=Hydrogenophaga sp. TaxID=1904254 RepID=UPI0026252198|nr:hypothetical protein [Hydrogenophaga sp.]MDM7951378.1 hypothetical protein [Hydrogenophaga sp.]